MKFVEKLFDIIFSFGTFMFLSAVAFIYFMVLIIEDDIADQKLLEKQTSYCYSIGSTLVETAGGRFCVAPSNLMVIK